MDKALNGTEATWSMLLANHTSEVLVLVLTLIVVVTLLLTLPQLLRASMRRTEMKHLERLRALEQNLPVPPEDERSRYAARTAILVPLVVMISTGVVTCFLVVYKSESLFAVSLAIWVVAGVVSLAAITGGMALLGRLANVDADEEADVDDSPFVP